MTDRLRRAEQLLVELRAGGCEVGVENGLVTFKPAPAARVLLELEELRVEVRELVCPRVVGEITALGFPVEVRQAPPTAWQGGTHDGSRLEPAQRKLILDLMADGFSDSEIRRRTGHGRNTIAAIAASPERAAWLKETRQARMLAAEDSLMRERDRLIEKLVDDNKLKLSDVNSAVMITGIGIKDSGGSAPVRVEVKVDHEFHAAAQLMGGVGVSNAAQAFAPVPPAMEVEVVPAKGEGEG